MIEIFVVSAFPDRRPAAQSSLVDVGGVKAESIHWVDAPVGRATTGFTASPRWRDPFEDKRFLNWGELACFSGHHAAWKAIVSSGIQEALVFEDDLKMLGLLLNVMHLVRGDIMYLGGKFMEEPKVQVDEGVWDLPYTYWTIGYYITAAAAQKLILATRPTDTIPVDEFIPYHCGVNPNVSTLTGQDPALNLSGYALDPWVVEPARDGKSGIVGSDSCYELKTVVFATDVAKAKEAVSAYKAMDYNPTILGSGEAGWDASGPGGISKLRWLRDWLRSEVDLDHKIIFAVDGYDTLPALNAATLMKRFAQMDADIVISGENTCWPDTDLAEIFDENHAASSYPDAPYPYPCSGAFIGFPDNIRHCLKNGLDDAKDDQLFLQQKILLPDDLARWRIDTEAYLFQSLNGAVFHVERRGGDPFNIKTNIFPAIIHANGPSRMDVARPLRWKDPELEAGAFQWIEVADGILAMPFLNEATCRHWVAQSFRLPQLWAPLKDDAVPGDELRLKAMDSKLFTWMQSTCKEGLAPVIKNRWRPAKWHDIADSFLIRYSKARQPDIGLHEDISYLSCSIRLKKSCAGGELQFPRQNFNDGLIPNGWLMVWPSRITHPHHVLPVRKGERISVVVWTKP